MGKFVEEGKEKGKGRKDGISSCMLCVLNAVLLLDLYVSKIDIRV